MLEEKKKIIIQGFKTCHSMPIHSPLPVPTMVISEIMHLLHNQTTCSASRSSGSFLWKTPPNSVMKDKEAQ